MGFGVLAACDSGGDTDGAGGDDGTSTTSSSGGATTSAGGASTTTSANGGSSTTSFGDGGGTTTSAGGSTSDGGGGSTTNASTTTSAGGPVCGNGIVETGENCDDGNLVGGDACNVYCVDPGTPLWTQTYLVPTNVAAWYGTTTDSVGAVYVTGVQETAAQVDNLIVRKYSPSGSIAWTQTYAGDGSAIGADIALDPQGNVIVVGRTGATDADQNVLVAKFNGNTGAFVWDSLLDYEGGFDTATGVAIDPAGAIYVSGVGEYGDPDYDYMIMKFAAGTGNYVIGAAFDANADADYANGIALGPDGAIYLVGTATLASPDFFVEKFTQTGTAQFADVWGVPFDGEGGDVDGGLGISVDAAGDIVAVGGFYSATGIGNATVIKLSASDGTTIWSVPYDDGLDSVAYRVDTDATGITVVGLTDTLNHGLDGWVRRYAPDGTMLWTQTYNGPASGGDAAYAVSIRPDGSTAVVGVQGIANGNAAWTRVYAP